MPTLGTSRYIARSRPAQPQFDLVSVTNPGAPVRVRDRAMMPRTPSD
jgi:hypothetical protein